MQPVGCLPLIIGGVIVYYSDNLKAFANACVEAGFNFYSALNVWDLGMFMISEYGVAFLCVVATPIVIGIIAAVITMVIAGIFWLVETIMTSRYNIKHPCPFCHNPSEPAIPYPAGIIKKSPFLILTPSISADPPITEAVMKVSVTSRDALFLRQSLITSYLSHL